MRGWCLRFFSSILVALTIVACAFDREFDLYTQEVLVHSELIKIGSSESGNYLAGRQAQKKSDYANAAGFLDRALFHTPKNTNLLRRTFLAKIAQGNVVAAVPLAEKISLTGNVTPIAELLLVISAVKSGDFKLARKQLQLLPDKGLNSVIKPLLKAWVIVGIGGGEEAIEVMKPLKLRPGLEILYELHAALICDVIGLSKKAHTHYETALKIVNSPPLRLVQAFGLHLENAGSVEYAQTLYHQYLNDNPHSNALEIALGRIIQGNQPNIIVTSAKQGAAEALFNIANMMIDQNSYKMGLIYGRLAVFLEENFDFAYMLVAGILEAMNKYNAANTVYANISKESPVSWTARLRSANNLKALDLEIEAIDLLEELSSEQPNRPDPLVSLGDLLREKKRFLESVEAYDRAIACLGKLDKRHWTIFYSRGISLERSKNWKGAEKDFQIALGLSPDQPYVLNYLGYSWVDQGVNLDNARKMIERAVKLRPNDGYIVDSLGWAFYRLKKYGAAVKQLERAAELRPQDPTINDHLGDAYWRVGRFMEAKFQWQRVLSLKPEADQVLLIEKKLILGLEDSFVRDRKN